MSEEDLPPDPFPKPQINYQPCPCGKAHEDHIDADTMDTLAHMMSTLLPDKVIVAVFTEPDNPSVGVIANAGTDAQTINLLGLGIAKIYSSSNEKDTLPMQMYKLPNPEDN